MADTPTRREWEAAQLAVESARRVGKKLDDCPPYGTDRKAANLREAWVNSWERAEGQMRRRG
ncbi:hypothetical protein [Lysobacter olei]